MDKIKFDENKTKSIFEVVFQKTLKMTLFNKM